MTPSPGTHRDSPLAVRFRKSLLKGRYVLLGSTVATIRSLSFVRKSPGLSHTIAAEVGSSHLPQHFLYFRPLPQGQRSFLLGPG